jgi:hypothetical protein
LRQVIVKLGRSEAATATELDLHGIGVTLAGKPHEGGRLLHKALDRRHRAAINRFARAKNAGEVRALWQEGLRSGEIPGAYWAVLTHPVANDALVREAFCEVHMLSHLVGAANRADIRRLRRLEAENADLTAKVERQQRQLRDAIVAREATIRELRRALENNIAGAEPAATLRDEPAWTALAADLKHRLDRSNSRSEQLARQLAECRSGLAAEGRARGDAEARADALRREVEALEASLAVTSADGAAADGLAPLSATVLYVGGRPAQIGHLRLLAERFGAKFLHHDGGSEERGGLLPGLVSRADAVLFPVDCVSHTAMSLVKRLCRQVGKPLLPLRGGGLAPFCAALRHPALRSAPD